MQEATDVGEGEERADAGVDDGEDAEDGEWDTDVADYVCCADAGRHDGRRLSESTTDGWVLGAGWGCLGCLVKWAGCSGRAPPNA